MVYRLRNNMVYRLRNNMVYTFALGSPSNKQAQQNGVSVEAKHLKYSCKCRHDIPALTTIFVQDYLLFTKADNHNRNLSGKCIGIQSQNNITCGSGWSPKPQAMLFFSDLSVLFFVFFQAVTNQNQDLTVDTAPFIIGNHMKLVQYFAVDSD